VTDENAGSSGGDSRRWSLPLAVAAGVAIGALVTAVALGLALAKDDNKSDSASSSTTSTTAPVQLTGAAKELADLIAAGHPGEYHARYAIESPTITTGTQATVETWRKGSLFRQDNRIVDPSGTRISSTYQLAEGVVSCTASSDSGPWTCKKVPGSGQASLDEAVADTTSKLDGAQVTASDATMGDEAVRCFDITISSGTTQVCLTKDGVPALQAAGSNRFSLLTLERSVGDVFTPPAPVTG
jgi:hypothetical protein